MGQYLADFKITPHFGSRPHGPKQQRPRCPRHRFANWRCCRNRNPLKFVLPPGEKSSQKVVTRVCALHVLTRIDPVKRPFSEAIFRGRFWPIKSPFLRRCPFFLSSLYFLHHKAKSRIVFSAKSQEKESDLCIDWNLRLNGLLGRFWNSKSSKMNWNYILMLCI